MPEEVRFEAVKRFVECPEGRDFLEGIRKHLQGHTIDQVEFTNNGAGITTTLRLDNGQSYAFKDDELCFEMLHEQFSEVFRAWSAHRVTGKEVKP